jgi:hypothetical protein
VSKFIRIGIADKNDNPPYFDKGLYEAEVSTTTRPALIREFWRQKCVNERCIPYLQNYGEITDAKEEAAFEFIVLKFVRISFKILILRKYIPIQIV